MARNWIPIGDKPLAFLDTETTGLDPQTHEIIEIAIITEYRSGRVYEWHTKIKPAHIERAHPKALEVNGYSEEAWADAPTFDQVAVEIGRRLSDVVVVGHNVPFDLDMVNVGLKRAGVTARISYHKIDTVTLAYEHLVPCGLQSVSFDHIRKFLGWSQDGAHTALKDTRDARRLFHLLRGAGHWRRFWWRLRHLLPR